jgi:hypothetical protein
VNIPQIAQAAITAGITVWLDVGTPLNLGFSDATQSVVVIGVEIGTL